MASVAPAEAAPRHASATSVIELALASVPGASQQQATRLADVLGQRGIAHAWQLAALRDRELAELVIDTAGWNLGELMALRVMLAQIPAVPPMPLPGVAENTKLRRLLQLPESASRHHVRAFSKTSRTCNFMGFCAPMLAMPAGEARTSLILTAQHTSNATAILAFVLWQFAVFVDGRVVDEIHCDTVSSSFVHICKFTVPPVQQTSSGA